MVDASRLVAALEVVWSGIRERHPDVPAVVVTLGAGSIGVPSGSLKLGHFAARRWVTDGQSSETVAELFVGGEGLQRGAESVLATLLHEAAHGIAHVRGVQDTSRQGRYHNGRYRELGEEVGLTITKTGDIGWSGTALAAGTAEEYSVEVDELADALVAYRRAEGQLSADPGTGPGGGGDGEAASPSGKRPKNGLVLSCACPRRIRASAAVVLLGPIVCGVCDADFEPA
ncbi:MAG: hypothetical protein ACRCW4_02330 [Candidatus Neomicrothrix subdominans]